jgi:hypothetical protein
MPEPPVSLPESGVPVASDHPFGPRGEWWSLCRCCGLSEPADTATTLPREAPLP